MKRERYLLDKSALVRWPKPAVARVLDELSDRGLRAVRRAVEIEVGVTVLHYDGDFDMISAITGQPTARVVSAGTAD